MSRVSSHSQTAIPTSNASVAILQMVPDDVMIYVHICLNITLRMAISAAGVLTNLFNMIIFSKLGLKDSMSIELFSLSMTDFVVGVIQVASCIFYITDLIYPSIEPTVWLLCYFVFAWAGNSTISMSSWITAMVSLERCLCVVVPFKAKQIFTRFRCIVVIIFIQLTHIVLGLPYVLEKVSWVGSRVSLIDVNLCGVLGINCTAIPSRGSTTFNTIIDLVVGASVSLLLQFVVIASTIWMGYSLQVSSRVRYASSDCTPEVTIKLFSVKLTETMSTREKRLVKVVMSLAIILTVCNAPQVVAAIVYHLVPGLNSEEQKNFSIILWTTVYTFGSLGCSSHFLVYLKLNRNYRRQFRKSFGLCHMTS